MGLGSGGTVFRRYGTGFVKQVRFCRKAGRSGNVKIRRKGERLAIIVRPGRYLQPESVDRERGRRFEESGDGVEQGSL